MTNGSEFQFLKLRHPDAARSDPEYALSDLFSLYRDRDWVLYILRRLAAQCQHD
ncbi:MAG: hypothetical protein HC910_13285 [Spirulinaceae cyanobacterium SM2_1_0]|nr:hypothetical protein [Spirulinaceae cyanobacterium SM2_1_0]